MLVDLGTDSLSIASPVLEVSLSIYVNTFRPDLGV